LEGFMFDMLLARGVELSLAVGIASIIPWRIGSEVRLHSPIALRASLRMFCRKAKLLLSPTKMNLPWPSRSNRASFGTGAWVMEDACADSVAGVFGTLLLPDRVSRDSMAISASFDVANASPSCSEGERSDVPV